LKLTVETEREEDGRWIAEVPDLAGVLAYGKTRDEAIARAEALALRVLAALYRIGWQLKREAGSHKTSGREGWPTSYLRSTTPTKSSSHAGPHRETDRPDA
jgi:predicted RNase H-like HicB family nuclease